jgi:hypothetical protein
MASIEKKFKAMALLEAISAMTILGIACTATFMTVEWILTSNPLPQRIRAEKTIKIISVNTKSQKRFIDEKLEIDGFSIERNIISYQDLKNTYIITYTAADQSGKKIITYNELIYIR